MNIIVFILVVVLVFSYLNWRQDKTAKEFWKKWEKDSFEWNGGRYSRDTFEIVDGKIKLK